MTAAAVLENTAIVLVRPRIPENIGACCRAMMNMGLRRLVVVAPENLEFDRIYKTATHVAVAVADAIQVCDSLETALSSFTYIAGTTARRGKQRQLVLPPEQLARKMVALSADNSMAILFGPEDRGLENDELRFCHNLITIPTADFSSLNLAQAVMIVCYEIFRAAGEKEPEFQPRLANHHELEGMYDHLKDALIKIDFVNRSNPDYWMNNFRRFFARVGLTAKEVRLIRGICRQINWYGEKRYADGKKEGRP
ncbi:MAG: RNA methyltransferase [Thermodesulfobacteriota bacterium]